MKMKKIVCVLLLAIILIGCGAKSKFDAQFPYQLDISSGDRVQAMKAFCFGQFRWSNAGSGCAGYGGKHCLE